MKDLKFYPGYLLGIFFFYAVVLAPGFVWSWPTVDVEKEKQKLLKVDQNFSNLSVRIGLKAAILHFLSPLVIIVPQKSYPVFGEESMQRLLSQSQLGPERAYLRWESILADVSSSGDYGYTLGRYDDPLELSAAKRSRKSCYLATVWRKDVSGSWKIICNLGLFDLESSLRNFIDSPFKIHDEAESLYAADRAFSSLSLEKGLMEAFSTYIADNGLTVSNDGRPPATKDSYLEQLKKMRAQNEKSETRLIWQPLYASISNGKDLGFSVGRYHATSFGPTGQEFTATGFYLTIWKKQQDGQWRFIFDGGNKLPVDIKQPVL